MKINRTIGENDAHHQDVSGALWFMAAMLGKMADLPGWIWVTLAVYGAIGILGAQAAYFTRRMKG